GIHGVQSDLSIRGSSFDQVLVLINGVKISDPQTGHHMMNLPVDIENIERIEVLKGPGARIYGQNAFAGAINIVTKLSDQKFSTINLQGGQHGLGGVHVGASLPNSNFKQYFSFSKDFARGYRPNTDYDVNNFFYQNSFKFVNHEIGLLAGYTEKEFGANYFYGDPYSSNPARFENQFESIQSSLVALHYQFAKYGFKLKPRVYWRRHQDEYVFVRSNPSLYRNIHIGNTIGLDINGSKLSDWGVTGFGLDMQAVYLRSNNLGNRSRNVITAFLEHRFALIENRLDITPGVSFNYFSDFGSNFLPGLDIGFDIWDGLKWYGNAGMTYRIPTYTDQFYSSPVELGNPDLQPEKAITYEAGLKYVKNGWNLQAGYFIRQGEDMIDWILVDTALWQPRNFRFLDVSGTEFLVDWYPGASYGPSFFLKKLHLGYTQLMSDYPEDAPASRYALEYLKHQVTVGADVGFRKLRLSVQYRYADRINVEDFSIVDARITYGGSKFSVFAEATNILDEKYLGANLIEMPGRWFRAGVRTKFMY
ncbi:MAG: TonB-dependent receptor, partial [Saprospiraceae bacterium]|nr:TonB-dependent receptor [Saprospiraceae bacterium]